MINLPKPSPFSGSAGIEVLPRQSPSLRQSPPSEQPCYYCFGLTSLPQDIVSGRDQSLNGIVQKLFACSQLLAIPSLFGRGDGQAWTLSTEHYPALLQWKEQQVPETLLQVARLLEALNTTLLTSTEARDEDTALITLVLGHVVCAVARYLPLSTDPGSSSAPQDEGWTSHSAQVEAQGILSGLSKQPGSSNLPRPSTIAKALLVDYIKPIFRETAASSAGSTTSVNTETGRKKPPTAGSAFIPHLDRHLGQHRFESAAEDNDASNLAPKRFALLLQGASQSLIERNEALGCINVLGWCLDNLQLKSESDWKSVWPLLVPPLITLLEHPQPRVRLRGTMMVHRLLLRPRNEQEKDAGDHAAARRREVVLGKILIRTGIGSLLEQALHVNLTYIHDEQYAPALLAHSIGALRQLILLTTYPIAYRDPLQHPFEAPSVVVGEDLGTMLDEQDDCGKRRMEALFRLVSEGILSTWSYLPLPPSSTRLGRELVSVTCTAYMTLADDLAAPATMKGRRATIGGVARFLDVSLDWIFRSWMSNVSFDHTDQVQTTIEVVTLASRLLFPAAHILPPSPESTSAERTGEGDDSSEKPNLPTRRFLSLILSSVAKCWISAQETTLRSSTTQTEGSGAKWKDLQSCLTRFMAELSRTDSSVEPRWADLVKVDERLALLLSHE